MDPFRLCVALGPVAIYLLLVGTLVFSAGRFSCQALATRRCSAWRYPGWCWSARSSSRCR